MGKFDCGSIKDYEMILADHDTIMMGLRDEDTPEPEEADGQGIPLLNQVEAKVITEEKLNEFFADVLRDFVCGILSLSIDAVISPLQGARRFHRPP